MVKTQVQKTVLDNGIRVVTEYMPFIRSVSVGIWIRVGSANEDAGNNGISHFLEHMLFKGTKKRSAFEIAASLESLGGSINGSTGKEISVYNAHVLDEHVEIAVDVLSDLLLNPQLGKKEIELERSVVLAEISHAKEDPEEMVLDLFCQNIYPNHPLGFFIYGTEENVAGFQRQALLDYLHREYTCDRTVVAAAGNIDHNRFVDLLAEKYQRPCLGSNQTPASLLPNGTIPYVAYKDDALYQAHICLGGKTFGYTDERKYAMALFDVMMGGGMSSRLFQHIREKYGFAYSVYSLTDFMAETGLFAIYMACAEDKAERSIDLIRKELKDINKKGISREELEQIKSQVKGNIILGMESSARRMRQIGENESYDSPHLSMEQLVEIIEQVTPGDIADLCREFFEDSRLSVTVLSPN
jgi:predicted Zn-dependent peptidase